MKLLTDWYQNTPFSTASWADWVDISLLAWLIYRGLLLIRGTRAMQSLLGLGLLALVYVASETFGLTTLHWVLDNLFVYVGLALLILFQEDIRRALARAGGTVFARPHRPSDANLLEEVVKACFSLAARRVGGLVAIERTASLSPYVSGAHEIGARVSNEILQSIFHPSSPLHDGAAVISGQQILAAGVFLPIALSKEISNAYGTRHRAAIGLTEVTDALVLVISEERGTVALVQEGMITPVADADELRERLQESLGANLASAPAASATVGG